MKKVTLIILAFVCFSSFAIGQTARSNKHAIDNAEGLALELNGSTVTSQLQIIPPYLQGKLKIISGEKNGVVVRIDKDGDGHWEEFLGIQSSERYKINEEIENGEIIYASKIAIINSKDDKRIYMLSLADGTKEIEAKIPNELRALIKLKLTGFGLHAHRGDYDFNDFLN